jgi:hypothetical protein
MEVSAKGESRLITVHRRLEQWRRRHGGPGTRIPEDLWDEAVAAARVDGIEATARALRLDPERLERRVCEQPEPHTNGGGRSQFVELQAVEVGSAARNVIELLAADGERMRIEITGKLDVQALAGAFWNRRR